MDVMRVRDAIVSGLLAVAALSGQEGERNVFEAADVHGSSPILQRDFMRGPFIRKGRLEIRNANMVDLISWAYRVDNDKVLGGPNWVEFYRYDVVAQPSATATQE